MPKVNFNNSLNAQMLKDVQDKSNTQVNAKTMLDIPLELIDSNPDNGKIFSLSEIQSLANNIETEGFIGSIDVYKKEDGRYEISAGHRRYEAMKLLKRKTIPATVSEMPLSDVKRRRRLIASNINTRIMNPMEIARAIEYHFETLELEERTERGLTTQTNKKYKAKINRIDEVAAYFNISASLVSLYRSLLNLIPELQEIIENRQAPWTSLSNVAKFDEKTQKEIYVQLKESFIQIEQDNLNDSGNKTFSGTEVAKIVKRVTSKQNEPAKEKSKSIRELPPPTDSAIQDIESMPVFGEQSEETTYAEEVSRINYIDNDIANIFLNLKSRKKDFANVMNKKLVLQSIENIEALLKELKKSL